ncbi:hypothetical protein RclHR1_04140014 [Rhizophagus clarus]|uniref:Uncharacterized protein n=1 Tax=Rhizophagus clarus TaxID=94130 RepID=A0A2Z6SA41_9GLOM|nr:hypothetical protein RclHR1_04140014 [Rhizophagus clarus]
MSGEGSSPAAVNSRTEITYKPKDIKDREFRLKHLKRITEINLNLVRDSRSDLYLTLFLCVFAIIIGIIFLTLRGLDRNKLSTFKVVSNSISGVVSGGVLLTNAKSIFSSITSTKSKDTIGLSEINEESIKISLTHPEVSVKFLKNVENTIEDRNEKLRLSRIVCSIFAIIGAFVLIALVIFDILLDVISQNTTNSYVFIGGFAVDLILIIGGVTGAVHCWTRHNILTCPEKFKEWYSFIFFFHLFFIGLIPFGCYGPINNEEINEDEGVDGQCTDLFQYFHWRWSETNDVINNNGNIYESFLKENDEVRFLFFKATVLRVILVKKEKINIERLLMGLDLEAHADTVNNV